MRYSKLDRARRKGTLTDDNASDVAERTNRQTSIQTAIAEETGQEEVDADSDQTAAVIDAVTDEQVGSSSSNDSSSSGGGSSSDSGSSGSGSSGDKGLNSPDVDTNDPNDPEESRSGPDATGDTSSQLKGMFEALAQESQSGESGATAADPPAGATTDPVGEMGAGGGSTESASSSDGFLEGNMQLILLVIASLGAVFVLTQRRGS